MYLIGKMKYHHSVESLLAFQIALKSWSCFFQMLKKYETGEISHVTRNIVNWNNLWKIIYFFLIRKKYTSNTYSGDDGNKLGLNPEYLPKVLFVHLNRDVSKTENPAQMWDKKENPYFIQRPIQVSN